MANAERLLNEGRLLEAEHEAQRLAIAMAGHRQRLRTLADPFEPIEQLDLAAMRVELDELQAKELRYDALLLQIAALRDALGKPRYEAR